MRTYFRSLSDVLGSPLAQTAQTPPGTPADIGC